MTRRRCYASPGAFSSDRLTVKIAIEEMRYLRDVLRLQPGAEVYVFDGDGKEFQCEIAEYSRDFASLRVVAEVSPTHPESHLDLTLATALLKGEKFDLVVQKATELGAMRILPVMTQRADVRLKDAGDANKRVTRWQRIALEAAKQSGRARVPEVAAPTSFASLIESQTQDNSAGLLMFSERDGEPLAETLTHARNTSLPLIALVGSEGGWADEEILQARASGWQIVTLGGRIMRAETAAIAVVVLLQHLLGDLN
jgi:16S rRNA (uracil1498-N3)-methyltransferase